jgi:hypothetical protein
MAAIYYQSHALRGLGRVDRAAHGDCPTAAVYVNDETKTRTFVAWNLAGQARVVTFFADGERVGQATVPPRSLIRVGRLELTR